MSIDDLIDTAKELREFLRDQQVERLSEIDRSITANPHDEIMRVSLEKSRSFTQANLDHDLFTESCTRMQEEAVNYFNAEESGMYKAHPATMRYADGNPRHEITIIEKMNPGGKPELFLFDPSVKQFSPPTDEIFENQHGIARNMHGVTAKEQLPGYRLAQDPKTRGWHEALIKDGVVRLTPEIAQQYLHAFDIADAQHGPEASLRHMAPHIQDLSPHLEGHQQSASSSQTAASSQQQPTDLQIEPAHAPAEVPTHGAVRMTAGSEIGGVRINPRVGNTSFRATAGSVGMNALGVVPVVVGMASDLQHHNVKGAAVKGVAFGGTMAVIKVATMAGAGRAVPIAGAAFGAVQSGGQAYHDFKTGHHARGVLDSIKTAAYATATVSGAATLADCWNPTVVAPAAVTAVALGVGATIDAGEAIYDSRKTIMAGGRAAVHWAQGLFAPHQAKPASPPAHDLSRVAAIARPNYRAQLPSAQHVPNQPAALPPAAKAAARAGLKTPPSAVTHPAATQVTHTRVHPRVATMAHAL